MLEAAERVEIAGAAARYSSITLCRPRDGPGYPARFTLGTPASSLRLRLRSPQTAFQKG
jgi:hypothetical protein